MIPESYFGFREEMEELFEFKSVMPVVADPVPWMAIITTRSFPDKGLVHE